MCISIGFHCHILCNNISLFSSCVCPLAPSPNSLQDTEIAEGGKRTGIPRINRSHTLPLPLLASPSYLPMAPHFPPSRGQTTTRDSVGFHRMNLSLCASAPLLSPLCMVLNVCGHIRPDWFGICGGALSWLIDLLQGGFSARKSEAVISVAPCPRGMFFTLPDIRSCPNGVLDHSLRRAARRAAPQNSIPSYSYILALPALRSRLEYFRRLSPRFPCCSTVKPPFVPIYTVEPVIFLSIPISGF